MHVPHQPGAFGRRVEEDLLEDHAGEAPDVIRLCSPVDPVAPALADQRVERDGVEALLKVIVAEIVGGADEERRLDLAVPKGVAL